MRSASVWFFHSFLFFFFNDTATTEIYTLSLHDALPISSACRRRATSSPRRVCCTPTACYRTPASPSRSEEHTSELQSQSNLVCRLLLAKKKVHLPLDSGLRTQDEH